MKRSLSICAAVLSMLSVLCACRGGIATESNPARLLGQVLDLPDTDTRHILGQDTTVKSADTKLVIYFETDGCTSCSLKQLNGWKYMLPQIEGGEVDCIFIINAGNRKARILASIEEYDFRYPVVWDDNGYFERHNTLPDNSLYHTFLLNRDNRVMLIGNPLYSPRLWERYKKKIKDLS